MSTHLKISEARRKPNKIWIDQGSEFYKNSFKDFLKINNIEMYSTYNEGKSVVAERFIRTLKNKIFKHMAAISKNVYFDVLDYIVNKYNNIIHRTIKITPINVTSDYHVGNHVRTSKYENIFAKGITPNRSAEFFVVSKIKNTVPWT